LRVVSEHLHYTKSWQQWVIAVRPETITINAKSLNHSGKLFLLASNAIIVPIGTMVPARWSIARGDRNIANTSTVGLFARLKLAKDA
jgi:hypothetical protein